MYLYYFVTCIYLRLSASSQMVSFLVPEGAMQASREEKETVVLPCCVSYDG